MRVYMVQKRVARFIARNYTFEEGSMTVILAELKWETHRKGERITDSYCFKRSERYRQNSYR